MVSILYDFLACVWWVQFYLINFFGKKIWIFCLTKTALTHLCSGSIGELLLNHESFNFTWCKLTKLTVKPALSPELVKDWNCPEVMTRKVAYCLSPQTSCPVVMHIAWGGDLMIPLNSSGGAVFRTKTSNNICICLMWLLKVVSTFNSVIIKIRKFHHSDESYRTVLFSGSEQDGRHAFFLSKTLFLCLKAEIGNRLLGGRP